MQARAQDHLKRKNNVNLLCKVGKRMTWFNYNVPYGYNFVLSPLSLLISFQGFVGTLGVHAVMLVWDQCFMSNWQPSVMEHACLVLLQLLRGDILHTEGYSGIRRVLLDKPCELFTVDIQQGLSYLSNGGALLDVGSLRP